MAAKRKAAPKSASERTGARRAELIAQGWAQKNWLLPPAALADLAAITERDGCTETEAVSRALALAANPKGELSNAELAALVARRLKGAPGPR